MILIVGGSFQGQEAFARRLFSERFGARPESRHSDGAEGDGILFDFHELVREACARREAPDTFTRGVLADRPKIVTMDEVGCGIVPLSYDDRIYREAVGLAGQILAAEADEVYRVICGIAARIK